MTFRLRALKTWGWVGIAFCSSLANGFDSFPVGKGAPTTHSNIPEITAPRADAALSPGERVTVQGAGSELSWLIEYWSTRDLAAGMHALAYGSGSAITFTVPKDADGHTLVRATLTGRSGSVSRDFEVGAKSWVRDGARRRSPSPRPES
jgi:hypothetical protein